MLTWVNLSGFLIRRIGKESKVDLLEWIAGNNREVLIETAENGNLKEWRDLAYKRLREYKCKDGKTMEIDSEESREVIVLPKTRRKEFYCPQCY